MGEEKKDYLSSLIDDDETTLESFQEEKVEHIEKPKRHIKKSVWVTLAILLVVAFYNNHYLMHTLLIHPDIFLN